MGNILNKYFATVGSKPASKIPQTINTFFDYLDPPLNRTFVFDPIIPEDINLEISLLQDNKAYGLYSSPVRLLKLTTRVISVPLATIFNQSICSGIFPYGVLRLSRYLRTKMTLCPKTTDLFHCSRFITGFLKNLCTLELPSLSKIATFSMISNTVFAVSTVLSMLYLILLTQFSKIWTTVNFRAVFSSISRRLLILSTMLESYGIKGLINSWFRSYLTDRKQTTEVYNVVSEAEMTTRLIGSVLGPLLFLLYDQ